MLAIVIVLFGVGRIAEIGKEMGSAVGEFRSGVAGTDEAESPDVSWPSAGFACFNCGLLKRSG